MDLRQYRQLVAIAEAGSVSRAAERLGMAQPALSAALSGMEKKLGSRLFIRTRSGVHATDAGARLLEQAQQVLANANEFDVLARDLAAGTAGRLRIGFITSALYDILPRSLAKLRARYPGVRIDLREMGSDALLQALGEGSVDVCFCRSPITARRGLREKLLSSVPLVAAVPSGFPRAANGSVTLADIVAFGLILPPETQSGLQARVLHAISQQGMTPRVTQEANRNQTMLACVAAGLGVALVPRSIQSTSFLGVHFCKVRPDVLPSQDISVVWRPHARAQLADHFVAMLSPRDFPGRGSPTPPARTTPPTTPRTPAPSR